MASKLFLSIMLLFLLLSLPLINAVGASSQMWSRTYGDEEQEVAQSLVETSDGGYAIAGYKRFYRASDDFWEDFWLVKTDRYGNLEWNRTYGGLGDECAYSLVETSDGGYAIAGQTSSFGAGSFDFWLIKVDGSGNMEWNQTYGGPGSERAVSLVMASDGGYAIAGHATSIYSSSIYSTDRDFWLIKTDANGNMEWNQTYAENRLDYASSVVETSDGGFAIAGVAWYFPNMPIGNSWLVKTDANGNLEWNRTYGEPDYGYWNSMVQTSDGGYALAGYTSSSPAGGGVTNNDVWLAKTDAFGNIEWNQKYGGLEDDDANSLIVTSDGGYALAGYTGSFGAEDYDFWLIKTDEYGIIPEFPSWIILPLFLMATFSAILLKKKLFHQRSQCARDIFAY